MMTLITAAKETNTDRVLVLLRKLKTSCTGKQTKFLENLRLHLIELSWRLLLPTTYCTDCNK